MFCLSSNSSVYWSKHLYDSCFLNLVCFFECVRMFPFLPCFHNFVFPFPCFHSFAVQLFQLYLPPNLFGVSYLGWLDVYRVTDMEWRQLFRDFVILHLFFLLCFTDNSWDIWIIARDNTSHLEPNVEEKNPRW